jgi:hypothetical protein
LKSSYVSASMCVLHVAHQLLGDADDQLSVRYGPDLGKGVSVEREALDNVLVFVGIPQRGGVASLRYLAKER